MYYAITQKQIHNVTEQKVQKQKLMSDKGSTINQQKKIDYFPDSVRKTSSIYPEE